MKEKLYYTTCGYLLLGCNLLLIDTRFNPIGLALGFVGAAFFLKAISIRKPK
jgi:hypothetical protein